MSAELNKRPGGADAASWAHRLLLMPTGAHEAEGHAAGQHEPTTAHLGHIDTAVIRSGATIYKVLYWMSLATAFLTAIYTFRMYFMTFYGAEEIPDEAGDHAHESPASMWVPLCILAAFAFAIGFALHRTHLFHNFLSYTPSLATDAARLTPQPGVFHMNIAITSSIVAVTGLACSAFLYLGRTSEARTLARLFSAPVIGAPYLVAKGKFFWDEIYDFLVVRPLRALASFCYGVDVWLVDGLVNAIGWLPKALGAAIRGLQMGLIPFYALAMVLGALSLVAAKLLWGGM